MDTNGSGADSAANLKDKARLVGQFGNLVEQFKSQVPEQYRADIQAQFNDWLEIQRENGNLPSEAGAAAQQADFSAGGDHPENLPFDVASIASELNFDNESDSQPAPQPADMPANVLSVDHQKHGGEDYELSAEADAQKEGPDYDAQ